MDRFIADNADGFFIRYTIIQCKSFTKLRSAIQKKKQIWREKTRCGDVVSRDEAVTGQCRTIILLTYAVFEREALDRQWDRRADSNIA